MIKNSYILLAALTLAAALSCTKEIETEAPEVPGEKGGKIVFTAHVAEGSSTKTSLDGVDVVWSEEDCVDAYLVAPDIPYWQGVRSSQTEILGDGSVARFTFDAYGDYWGKFEIEGHSLIWYAAYTPFFAIDDYRPTSNEFEAIPVVFPSTQIVPEGGGFADGANVAVAYVSDPDNLYFKNVGGLIAVKIKGAGTHEIETIRISGTEQSGGAMTGEAQVKVNSANEITSVVCTGSDYVLLVRDEMASMQVEDIYYAVVAPGTYTDVTISFIDKEGYVATYTKKTDLVVTSNSNQLIGGFDIPESKWTKEGNIDFADDNVKALLVSKFDTNGDGEISYAEAEEVTSFDGLFYGCGEQTQYYTDEEKPIITSFDEFRFFTGMTSLEANAFAGCDKLTSILLPRTLTDIGESAFNRCSNLYSIFFPEQVETIGAGAFQKCDRLESVTLPPQLESIEDYLFSSCGNLTQVYWPDGLKSIGNYAFVGAGFSSLVIPDTVESIGEYAFSDCEQLTEVVWPERVKTIERATFQYCYKLTSFAFPDGFENIGAEAFRYSGLTEIEWPIYQTGDQAGESSLHSIGSYAFMGCNIETLDFPEVWWSIGKGVFKDCRYLKQINIPESVYDIGEETFAECESLTSVTIPKTVSRLEDKAFYKCTKLKDVTLDEGIIEEEDWDYYAGIGSIGNETFAECRALTSLTIPKTVSSIGEKAFYKCVKLQTVTLAEAEENEWGDYLGLNSIGNDAFAECSALNTIAFPISLERIGSRAFTKTGLTSVSLSKVHYLGEEVFSNCSSLREASFPGLEEDEWSDFEMWQGIFENCERLVSVSIPEGLYGIRERTFKNCIRLASINLPTTISCIESYAFAGCALTSLTIPGDSFWGIYDGAFQGCSSLGSLTLSAEEPAFDEYFLGENIFEGTPDSFKVYVPTNLVEDYKNNDYWGVYADQIFAIE